MEEGWPFQQKVLEQLNDNRQKYYLDEDLISKIKIISRCIIDLNVNIKL